MKKYLLYGHGGSYNHGAEAIVKTTAQLIHMHNKKVPIYLSTHFCEQDIEFNLPVDKFLERNMQTKDLDSHSLKLGKNILEYKNTLDVIDQDTICLSIGGDNYCYKNWQRYSTINEFAKKKGAKTVLWSCSLDTNNTNDNYLSAIQSHKVILARESLTYNFVEQYCSNMKADLIPDCAFLLKAQKVHIPNGFQEANTIGLNISPLIVSLSKSKNKILLAINNFINYILHNTTMNIALIPHVVMPSDNDIRILNVIYNYYKYHKRICIISENLSASEYKYIISKCRFFIGARTHAMIAAYSSCIPSIAITYSTKGRGIAKDIMGTDDHCAITLEELSNGELIKYFIEIQEKETYFKNKLIKQVPFVIKSCQESFLSWLSRLD